MGRPTTIRDEDILEAARATLLEHGWSATTAQVAARAGVSEGTLFHRFKSKDDLLRAAMLTDTPPVWIAELPTRIGSEDVEAQLAAIAHGGIAFFRVLIPFVMLHWSRRPGASRRHPPERGGPLGSLRRLASYFDAEMRLGRMARHDPDVVARAFSGALWNFVSMEILFAAPALVQPSEGTFVRSLVRLLLDGLTPAAPRSPAPRPARAIGGSR